MKEELLVDQMMALDQSDVSGNESDVQTASGELLSYGLGRIFQLRANTNCWKHQIVGFQRKRLSPTFTNFNYVLGARLSEETTRKSVRSRTQ